MPERLFVFIQAELPFRLALGDGRYVVRARAGDEPEHVLVVRTLGRRAAPAGRGLWRLRPRRRDQVRWGREVAAEPEPVASANTRATVIDPVSLSAERQSRAWLEAIDPEKEIGAAFGVINRALYAQRIAAADTSVHAISPAAALAIRAGWGRGEQVADGHWSHARELHWVDAGPRRGAAALRPQERFTALLGARAEPLLAEELALRAREDLEQGRIRLAALELERAYAAASAELGPPPRSSRAGDGGSPRLAERLEELEALRAGVAGAAAAALPPHGGRAEAAQKLDRDAITHPLARLEAMLRARAAAP